ncbi:MAG: hypothetical protein PUE90_10830 [Bacteroidales bacterium]|nr:hypothetical protein [Bacteroidales bacterium]
MARNVIVLDRMFSGSYLEENIGHEIINLYQSDNRKNYIYLSPDGNFDAKYKDRIACVILTQDNGTNQDKVVGLAEIDCDVYQHGDTILKQINYIVKYNVKYGGTYAHIPFMANKSQQDIIIDFKAKALYQPTKEIIIDYSAKRNTINNKGVLVVSVGGLLKKSRKSLKQYVEPSEENHNPAYDVLLKFINDDKLWKKTPNLIKKGKINSPEANKIVMINKFSEAVEKGKVLNKYFG